MSDSEQQKKLDKRRRSSILKPTKQADNRAPLVDLGAVKNTTTVCGDDDTTTTSIFKKRVSFAGIKIKEFSSLAHTKLVPQTPAYDEFLSSMSDSSHQNSDASNLNSPFMANMISLNNDYDKENQMIGDIENDSSAEDGEEQSDEDDNMPPQYGQPFDLTTSRYNADCEDGIDSPGDCLEPRHSGKSFLESTKLSHCNTYMTTFNLSGITQLEQTNIEKENEIGAGLNSSADRFEDSFQRMIAKEIEEEGTGLFGFRESLGVKENDKKKSIASRKSLSLAIVTQAKPSNSEYLNHPEIEMDMTMALSRKSMGPRKSINAKCNISDDKNVNESQNMDFTSNFPVLPRPTSPNVTTVNVSDMENTERFSYAHLSNISLKSMVTSEFIDTNPVNTPSINLVSNLSHVEHNYIEPRKSFGDNENEESAMEMTEAYLLNRKLNMHPSENDFTEVEYTRDEQSIDVSMTDASMDSPDNNSDMEMEHSPLQVSGPVNDSQMDITEHSPHRSNISLPPISQILQQNKPNSKDVSLSCNYFSGLSHSSVSIGGSQRKSISHSRACERSDIQRDSMLTPDLQNNINTKALETSESKEDTIQNTIGAEEHTEGNHAQTKSVPIPSTMYPVFTLPHRLSMPNPYKENSNLKISSSVQKTTTVASENPDVVLNSMLPEFSTISRNSYSPIDLSSTSNQLKTIEERSFMGNEKYIQNSIISKSLCLDTSDMSIGSMIPDNGITTEENLQVSITKKKSLALHEISKLKMKALGEESVAIEEISMMSQSSVQRKSLTRSEYELDMSKLETPSVKVLVPTQDIPIIELSSIQSKICTAPIFPSETSKPDTIAVEDFVPVQEISNMEMSSTQRNACAQQDKSNMNFTVSITEKPFSKIVSIDTPINMPGLPDTPSESTEDHLNMSVTNKLPGSTVSTSNVMFKSNSINKNTSSNVDASVISSVQNISMDVGPMPLEFNFINSVSIEGDPTTPKCPLKVNSTMNISYSVPSHKCSSRKSMLIRNPCNVSNSISLSDATSNTQQVPIQYRVISAESNVKAAIVKDTEDCTIQGETDAESGSLAGNRDKVIDNSEESHSNEKAITNISSEVKSITKILSSNNVIHKSDSSVLKQCEHNITSHGNKNISMLDESINNDLMKGNKLKLNESEKHVSMEETNRSNLNESVNNIAMEATDRYKLNESVNNIAMEATDRSNLNESVKNISMEETDRSNLNESVNNISMEETDIYKLNESMKHVSMEETNRSKLDESMKNVSLEETNISNLENIMKDVSMEATNRSKLNESVKHVSLKETIRSKLDESVNNVSMEETNRSKLNESVKHVSIEETNRSKLNESVKHVSMEATNRSKLNESVANLSIEVTKGPNIISKSLLNIDDVTNFKNKSTTKVQKENVSTADVGTTNSNQMGKNEIPTESSIIHDSPETIFEPSCSSQDVTGFLSIREHPVDSHSIESGVSPLKNISSLHNDSFATSKMSPVVKQNVEKSKKRPSDGFEVHDENLVEIDEFSEKVVANPKKKNKVNESHNIFIEEEHQPKESMLHNSVCNESLTSKNEGRLEIETRDVFGHEDSSNITEYSNLGDSQPSMNVSLYPNPSSTLTDSVIHNITDNDIPRFNADVVPNTVDKSSRQMSFCSTPNAGKFSMPEFLPHSCSKDIIVDKFLQSIDKRIEKREENFVVPSKSIIRKLKMPSENDQSSDKNVDCVEREDVLESNALELDSTNETHFTANDDNILKASKRSKDVLNISVNTDKNSSTYIPEKLQKKLDNENITEPNAYLSIDMITSEISLLDVSETDENDGVNKLEKQLETSLNNTEPNGQVVNENLEENFIEKDEIEHEYNSSEANVTSDTVNISRSFNNESSRLTNTPGESNITFDKHINTSKETSNKMDINSEGNKENNIKTRANTNKTEKSIEMKNNHLKSKEILNKSDKNLETGDISMDLHTEDLIAYKKKRKSRLTIVLKPGVVDTVAAPATRVSSRRNTLKIEPKRGTQSLCLFPKKEQKEQIDDREEKNIMEEENRPIHEWKIKILEPLLWEFNFFYDVLVLRIQFKTCEQGGIFLKRKVMSISFEVTEKGVREPEIKEICLKYLYKRYPNSQLKDMCTVSADVLPLLQHLSTFFKNLCCLAQCMKRSKFMYGLELKDCTAKFSIMKYDYKIWSKVTMDLHNLDFLCPKDVKVEPIVGNLSEADVRRQFPKTVRNDPNFMLTFIENCYKRVEELHFGK